MFTGDNKTTPRLKLRASEWGAEVFQSDTGQLLQEVKVPFWPLIRMRQTRLWEEVI